MQYEDLDIGAPVLVRLYSYEYDGWITTRHGSLEFIADGDKALTFTEIDEAYSWFEEHREELQDLLPRDTHIQIIIESSQEIRVTT